MRYLMTAAAAAFGLAATVPLAQAQPVVAPEHMTVRADCQGSPPWCFRDANGQWIGITVEILDALAAEVGFTVQHLEPMVFADLTPALLDGRIDTISQQYQITTARLEQMAFTVPYNQGAGMLAVLKTDTGQYRTFADLAGQVVASVQGANFSQQALANAGTPGGIAEVRLFASTAEVMAALEQGQVKAAVVSGSEVGYRMAQGDFPLERLVPEFAPQGLAPHALPFRKDWADLIAAINPILTRIATDGTVRDIMAKYGVQQVLPPAQ